MFGFTGVSRLCLSTNFTADMWISLMVKGNEIQDQEDHRRSISEICSSMYVPMVPEVTSCTMGSFSCPKDTE